MSCLSGRRMMNLEKVEDEKVEDEDGVLTDGSRKEHNTLNKSKKLNLC